MRVDESPDGASFGLFRSVGNHDCNTPDLRREVFLENAAVRADSLRYLMCQFWRDTVRGESGGAPERWLPAAVATIIAGR